MDPLSWFRSLPPITRAWFGAALLVNAAATMDLLRPEDLLLDWPRVTRHVELWRLATCFLYGGGYLQEFHVLLLLYMIAMQSSAYENNPHFAGGTPRADYAFCLIVCVVTTLVTFGLFEYSYHLYFQQDQRWLYPLFGRTLITAITYLWARRNPNVHVTINFIPIPLPGRYLPFAHLAMAYALGNPISELVHGMLVGHVYYYLVQVIPSLRGGQLVVGTPAILVQLVQELSGEQEEFRHEVMGPPPTQHHSERRAAAAQERRRFQRVDHATEAHVAAKLGNLSRLCRLAQTQEGRASLTATDRNDWQPLHEAVRGGYLDVVEFLLVDLANDHGLVVDKNARTNGGRGPSPLWIAESTHGRDHPVTRRLEELGAVKIGPTS